MLEDNDWLLDQLFSIDSSSDLLVLLRYQQGVRDALSKLSEHWNTKDPGPGGIRYGKQYRARCDYGFDNNKSRMVNSSSDMVERLIKEGNSPSPALCRLLKERIELRT